MELPCIFEMPKVQALVETTFFGGLRQAAVPESVVQATFDRLAIRSAYRSPEVNAYGNPHFPIAPQARGTGRATLGSA